MNIKNIIIISLTLIIINCSSLKDKDLDFKSKSDPQTWLDIADRSQEQGNHQRALKEYKSALKLDPQNQAALTGQAKTYNSLQKYNKSLDTWNILLTNQPENTEAMVAKSKILIRHGRLSDAETTLTKASTLDATNWQIWDGLGIIQDLQKNYSSSAEHYKKALEINPKQPEIYNNLGYSQIMAKQFNQAIETLQTGLQFKPSSHRMRNNLAIAYAWKGEYKEARGILAELLGSEEAYNNVGYIALLRKDYDEAEEHFNTAISLSPSFYRKAFINLKKLKMQRANEKIGSDNLTKP